MKATLGIFAFMVITWLYVKYCELKRLRQDCEAAERQIDNQLRSRYDLIPEFVETVKHGLKRNPRPLINLIQARENALCAKTISDKAVADAEVTQAIYDIFETTELTVLSCHELTHIAAKVNYAAHYYNDIAQLLNLKLQRLPYSWLTMLAQFRPRELYQT
jgi:LemA protein